MRNENNKCTKIRQAIYLLVTIACSQAYCLENNQEALLKALSPLKKVEVRGPSSYAPNTELEPTLISQELWIERTMIPDDQGILNETKTNLEKWQEREEYVENWNLHSMNLYNAPDKVSQKSYFMRNLLKYADKRLSGEMKKAEKGSTMAKVATAHKAVSPQSTVGVSKNVKLKFRARLLQGLAVARVENPYVEFEASAKVDGSVGLNMKKEFKDVGVTSELNYAVNNGLYVASVTKSLTTHLSSRVTTYMTNLRSPASNDSEKKAELLYGFSF